MPDCAAAPGPGTAPTMTFPSAAPDDDTGRQMRGEERPGHERPPELLEHDRRGRGPQTEPSPVLGQPQREHPGLGELGPSRRVDGRPLALGGPRIALEREPSRAQPAHPVGQRHLVLGELEVHGCRCLALGQAEDPLGDDVALDLRRPRRDGAREAVHPGAHDLEVADRTSAPPAPPGMSPNTSPVRPARSMTELARCADAARTAPACTHCRRSRAPRCAPPARRCAAPVPTARRARRRDGRPGGAPAPRPMRPSAAPWSAVPAAAPSTAAPRPRTPCRARSSAWSS